MILEKLKNIFERDFDIDGDEITPDTNLFSDLDFDELDLYDMVMSVEDDFEMELPDEDLEKIKTIGDLIKFIEGNQ